ncbi:MAG TPA: tetratricopeptide repeat protein, partial [Bryobacteraceae bacterium]|nr:tetratricopeptide repeat protein [Bryobacteraceae bacterium]
ASKPFRQSERLKRFLGFIVREALAGRGDQLKEFVVGVEVFDRDTVFDPRKDPIVRVEARRLRSQLARYYSEEGQGDATIIELPKGGYAPVFRTSRSSAPDRSSVPLHSHGNSVTIAPFADYTRSGQEQHFCRGLVQAITQCVCGVRGLRTLAWPRTIPFDREEDLTRIAGNLKASLVVCGGVRITGGTRIVNVQLLDAEGGHYLWSESIQSSADDDVTAQQRVAETVADRLRAGLGSGFQKAGNLAGENLAARNLWVQGRYHLNQRTEESLKKALEFFERATDEDAQFALAYSGLADTYGLLAHYGVIPPAEAWSKAASNAAWAVMMDENSAEAHTSHAHVKASQDWEWSAAEHGFRRAIDLDPRYSTARHWYAMTCLVPLGRLAEARREIVIAEELDPISSIIARDHAFLDYYLRDFEAALDQCDHTIQLNPHFAAAYWMLSLVQEQMGDLEESVAAAQRAVQLSPQSPRMMAALARVRALSGQEAEARAILDHIRSAGQKRYVSPFDLAIISIALGMPDEALDLLHRALADRCFELTFAQVDPRLDPMRGDPRFETVVAQIGVASAQTAEDRTDV